MKMLRPMLRRLPPTLLCLLALAVAGCSSYDRQAARGRNLTEVKRFFILSNQNDNHGIDRQIEAALQLRTREADTGPLTMMPDGTQALVSYEDHWTWDFGEHLVYLEISARDARSGQPYSTVRFSAKIPTRQPLETVIGQLVDRLLAGD